MLHKIREDSYENNLSDGENVQFDQLLNPPDAASDD